VAANWGARALARALATETAAWDDGRREPQTIASHWRPRLDPARVCAGLLNALAAV
jgi:hypothetical protein